MLAEADEPAMTPQEFIEKITELERKKNDPGILDKLLKLLGFDKSGGQKLYTIKVGGADQKFLWYPDKSVFIQIDPPLFKMRSGADIDPATLKGKGSTFPNVDSFNTLVDRAKRTEGKDKEAFILQMQEDCMDIQIVDIGKVAERYKQTYASDPAVSALSIPQIAACIHFMGSGDFLNKFIKGKQYGPPTSENSAVPVYISGFSQGYYGSDY